MLPLKNVPEKWNLLFNSMVSSDKELETRISGNSSKLRQSRIESIKTKKKNTHKKTDSTSF